MSISSNTNLRIVIVKNGPKGKVQHSSLSVVLLPILQPKCGVKGRFSIQGSHCEGVISEQSRVKVEAANLSLEIYAWH